MFYIKPMVHPLPFCGKRFFPVHLAPVSDNKGAVIYCGEVCVWEGGGGVWLRNGRGCQVKF